MRTLKFLCPGQGLTRALRQAGNTAGDFQLPAFHLFTIFFFIFLFQTLSSHAVTLTWSANDASENITGYKIYYGLSTGQYSGFEDVGNVTACEIEDVISTLEEGTTYYLTATAYSGVVESPYCPEIVYTHTAQTEPVPVEPSPDPIDSDGDGLTDSDEMNIYFTDPTSADSDNDGIADGKELAYWGTSWNQDIDGDQYVNLVDWDSDGDGIADGDELDQQTDPAVAEPPVSDPSELSVNLLSPIDGISLTTGDIEFSCHAVSQTSGIGNITLYSDYSGSWLPEEVYYPGEITATGTGLISLFHFNDSIEDLVNGEHFDSTGTVFSSTSLFGSSASFASFIDRITIPNTSGRLNSTTNELSIEAWVYPTEISDWGYIVSKAWEYQLYPYLNYGLGFYNGTGRMRFVLSIDGYQHAVYSEVLQAGDWYHIVGTFSGNNEEMKIYVNGVLQGSQSVSGTLDSTSADLIIGAYQYLNSDSWKGTIDELAIYDTALTADEISDHFAYDTNDVTAVFKVDLAEEWATDWNCRATDLDGLEAWAEQDSILITQSEGTESSIIFEDAEDMSVARWSLPDGTLPTTIENVTDPDLGSQVIAFTGSSLTSYDLTNFSYDNATENLPLTLGWNSKFEEIFLVTVDLTTSEGEKKLIYWPGNLSTMVLSNMILIGLGESAADGTWQTFTRNLTQDLNSTGSAGDIVSLDRLMIRGQGRIDDIYVDTADLP